MFGHAVGAAEVALFGERDAEVVVPSPERVQEVRAASFVQLGDPSPGLAGRVCRGQLLAHVPMSACAVTLIALLSVADASAVAAVDTVLRFGVAAVHRDRLLSILYLCLVQAGLSGREAPRESGPESCGLKHSRGGAHSPRPPLCRTQSRSPP